MSKQNMSKEELYKIFQRIRDANTQEELNDIFVEYGEGPYGKEINAYRKYKWKQIIETQERHVRLLVRKLPLKNKDFFDEYEEDREIEWIRHYQLGKLSPIFPDQPMKNLTLPPEDKKFFEPLFSLNHFLKII